MQTFRARSDAFRGVRCWFSVSPEQATFRARGFGCVSDPQSQRRLEAIGRTFLRGYNVALRAPDPDELLGAVNVVSEDLRGFAAEGATMAVALSELLGIHTFPLRVWLTVIDREFTYLCHVGVGWALARVPCRQERIFEALDPIHYWLAYDGLGFHDAYFRTVRVRAGWRRIKDGYGARAYEQGIGRALWFICGGDHRRAIAEIQRAPEETRGDLWAGLGLAITYAGRLRLAALLELGLSSGLYRLHLLQGAAFGAEARARAGHVPEYTSEAVETLTASPWPEVVAIVRTERERLSNDGGSDEAPYETWRRAVRARLMSRQRLHAC
jgi:enediyne biosynthesis protein E3